MSEVKDTDTETSIISCASCGVAEVDDIQSEHEESCKIRAAELRDELLFKQPEGSYLGDCPICCLPLSIDLSKSTMWSCCSKIICNGCHAANKKASLDPSCPSCPFCRTPVSGIDAEQKERMIERIKANDPFAMIYIGNVEKREGNYDTAFELLSKAAELGHARAHYWLSHLYQDGLGVGKDWGKQIYHLEEAAIRGHPKARHFLGIHEVQDNNNNERAVKHFLIAAAEGVDESIKSLMELFKQGQGYVSKEDLATALRAHQAAVDATKSPLRDAAEVKRAM